MHAEVPTIDIDEQIQAGPLSFGSFLSLAFPVAFLLGLTVLIVAFFTLPSGRVWSSYYVSLLFFFGLGFGGVTIAAIFQIVRATWSASLRRLAEAQVAFLPIGLMLLLVTWFGRHDLFPWANAPRPGSEWWMQPWFVYLRVTIMLFGVIAMMVHFVALSLREDLGVIEERGGAHKLSGIASFLVSGWQGAEKEVARIQKTLSLRAPLMLILYAVCYSLFTFEMVKAMDKMWVSSLFGAFFFVGNVYISWALLSILTSYFAKSDKSFATLLAPQQFWDLGKLTFGFCMLWGYFFLSQFLPQWYGNLPEETQWLILRSREYPWKPFAYFVFGCSFVIPFIVLLSREVKKNPPFLVSICTLILIGVWSEKFILVMPHVSPDSVPIGFLDVGIFLGFFGLYGLCLQWFLRNFPRVAIGHPLTKGETEW